MVCKRCGDQVDTDYHTELISDNGLCKACEDQEKDIILDNHEAEFVVEALEDTSDASK
jgi:NMD protein affecting ribosome stability and mRNA decay